MKFIQLPFCDPFLLGQGDGPLRSSVLIFQKCTAELLFDWHSWAWALLGGNLVIFRQNYFTALFTKPPAEPFLALPGTIPEKP